MTLPTQSSAATKGSLAPSPAPCSPDLLCSWQFCLPIPPTSSICTFTNNQHSSPHCPPPPLPFVLQNPATVVPFSKNKCGHWMQFLEKTHLILPFPFFREHLNFLSCWCNGSFLMFQSYGSGNVEQWQCQQVSVPSAEFRRTSFNDNTANCFKIDFCPSNASCILQWYSYFAITYA